MKPFILASALLVGWCTFEAIKCLIIGNFNARDTATYAIGVFSMAVVVWWRQ
jgi:hypothetical protein